MKLFVWYVLFAIALEATALPRSKREIDGSPESRPNPSRERQMREKERLLKRWCSKDKPKVVPTDAETAGNAVEGDIMMSLQERQLYDRWRMRPTRPGRLAERKATTSELLWPGGIIPYEFNTLDASMVPYVEFAMEEWAEKTCIEFVPYPAPGVNHLGKISFINGVGCYAYMGFRNQTRPVSLQKVACQSEGVALHEIGHTIGLMHEHVRHDRDGFVSINEENIQPGTEGNFVKRDPLANGAIPFYYDVCSVMHYNSRAFSTNGQPTIVANHSDYQAIMGKQLGLTHFDHEMVNFMYSCNAHCNSGLVCSNGGYVGKKCTCVCPSGFTGATCDDLVNQSVCGGKITVTSTGTVTSPNYPGNYGDNQECHWLLQGPAGSRISVRFNDFYVESGGSDCVYDRFEVRKEVYLDKCLLTYCAGVLQGQSHESFDNTIMLSLYSDFSMSYQGFSATYSLI
ncbi:blastula protease 10-like [Ptychodera flava]|uniref:blastula protease 10-like n=1 Tax=Ptychodera flava TaxID=63121 RepID=UPI00396A0164